MNGTFSNMLAKIQAQREQSRVRARFDLLKRAGLTEKDVDGLRYSIVETLDSRSGAVDVIELRLYKLVEASSITIEGQVRTVVEEGVENLTAIKNQPEMPA